MTPTQRQHLTAAIPADLPCPAAISEPERTAITQRWPTLAPIDRFAIVRMFGRSEARAEVEPCMMLLRTWGVRMRAVIDLVRDETVRGLCRAKLGYVNRHEKT